MTIRRRAALPASLLMLALAPALLAGCARESEAVGTVKAGVLDTCPSATVGEMADAYLSDPSWSDAGTADGKQLVDVSGGVNYAGEQTTATIRFSVDAGTKDFSVAGVALGSQDKDELFLAALILSMCKAAG